MLALRSTTTLLWDGQPRHGDQAASSTGWRNRGRIGPEPPVLGTRDEIAEAERAQLLSWTATLKLGYVRVVPSEIIGRRFRLGAGPDSESRFG